MPTVFKMQKKNLKLIKRNGKNNNEKTAGSEWERKKSASKHNRNCKKVKHINQQTNIVSMNSGINHKTKKAFLYVYTNAANIWVCGKCEERRDVFFCLSICIFYFGSVVDMQSCKVALCGMTWFFNWNVFHLFELIIK